jgi:hypothetical protein
MAKHKKPRQHSPEPDIFERFGNQLAKAGGIDRLLLFGAPASSNHGGVSAGEFVIDPQIEKWLVAIDEAEEATSRRWLL